MIAETSPLPQSLAEWEKQRGALRERLWAVLGEMPPLFMPEVRILSKTMREGCLTEHFAFENGAGATVFGYFLTPPDVQAPLPAVLYLHVHGGKYQQGKEELFLERVPNILPAKALTEAGFAVMAIDAYGFGERHQFAGESGAGLEAALYKHFLWRGSTYWGMLLRDDLMALDYLLSRPEIDPKRVALTGMSLGGSRATWIAALDERPQVVIPVAQMTRWRNFDTAARYNGHGIYYYLPGLLRESFDMEHLVALAAPRSQTILIGDDDPLSPIDGVHAVNDFARQIYNLYGAADSFQTIIEKGIGHVYTPSMFDVMLNSLREKLINPV